MFFGTMWPLAVAVVGIILCFIGFGLRDRNPGLVLMGIGLLAVLYAVFNKAKEFFG